MKYEHINSKEKKSFSLLIIPESNKIKQIKISTWIPKFLFLFIITAIISFSIYTYNLYSNYNELHVKYSDNAKDLELVTKIKDQQNSEIISLKKKTTEIEEKLNSINILQATVKEMVGLDKNKKSDNESGSRSTLKSSDRGLIQNTSLDDEYDFHIDELSRLLDESNSELNDLIDDVDKKLKYLDSKPNKMPTYGRITSYFGWRSSPFSSRKEFHYGLDIANDYYTTVRAAGKGIVTFAGYNGTFGKVVKINHGYGYESVYAHLAKFYVKVGDKVDKNQSIAAMGSTGRSSGPHLHFEVRLYGERINPLKVINKND